VCRERRLDFEAVVIAILGLYMKWLSHVRNRETLLGIAAWLFERSK
jgi:hypothetical protein